VKNAFQKNTRQAGFTAGEMMVACAVLSLLGLVFFQVLNSGVVLYSKNTAVNIAHEEAREGVNRLTRDIHAAVSVPQLRDNGFNTVSSTPVGGVPPTAAGVSFQNVSSGPNFVWQDPISDQLIMIKDQGAQPVAGQHIIIPFWGIEDDITKVVAASVQSHSNVFLANGAEATVAKKAPLYGGTTYAITYYTERVMYVVKNGSFIPDSQGPYTLTTGTYTSGSMDRYTLTNGSYVSSPTGTTTLTVADYTSGSAQRYRFENGELHCYKQRYSGSAFRWQDIATVARYISSAKPFYIPLNSGGSPDTKYVGVKLTARDSSSSNRAYLATASLLDTQIDYRARIALYQ
jgi:hypothetical protein